MKSTRVLQTAEARRADVLAAAIKAFARTGYWGANTTEIAKAAGISQAYLYRLFANKEDLFIAVLNEVHVRLRASIVRALNAHPSEDATTALLNAGKAVAPTDPDAAMVLLHAVAAATVKPIGDAVRDCYRRQAQFLASQGVTNTDIRSYLAWAQYANALHAADITSSTGDEDLRRLVVG